MRLGVTNPPGFKSPILRSGLPTELPVSYRQNCGGDLIFCMAPGSDAGGGCCVAWRGSAGGADGWAGARLTRRAVGDRGGGSWLCLSAVGEVVAQAGPAPA